MQTDEEKFIRTAQEKYYSQNNQVLHYSVLVLGELVHCLVQDRTVLH